MPLTILLDESTAYSGNYSVHFAIPDSMDGRENFIWQNNLDPGDFPPDSRFLVSGYYKADKVDGEINFVYVFRDHGYDFWVSNDWDNTHPSEPNVWEQFEFAFTIPGDANYSNYTLSLNVIKYTNQDLNLWVDDVKLERIE